MADFNDRFRGLLPPELATALNSEVSQADTGGAETVVISSDGTKATFLAPTGQYLRIGDAGVTSHSLAANDDLFVSGKLEVDGAAFFDGTVVGASSIYGASLGITSLFDITSDGTKVTLLPATGDYLRVGDATTTSHTLNTNDDLLVTGRLEVDGALFADSTILAASTIYGSALGITSLLDITSDGTKVTLLPASGDYLRVGDAGVTSHSLAANDDLLVSGILEVDGALFADSTITAASTIYGSALGITSLLDITSDGTKTTLLPATGDYLRVGSGDTSHALAANDDLLVSGILEVNGFTYLDGGLVVATDSQISIGSGFNARLYYSSTETPDSLVMGLPATSNSLIVCETGDVAFDHAHALQTNPTIYIHSAAQSTTQWLGLTHDGTDGVITLGTGVLRLPTNAVAEVNVSSQYISMKTADGTSVKVLCA